MRSKISRFAPLLSASGRWLMAILTFGSSFVPAFAADRLTVADPGDPLPMRFALHREGPSDQCRTSCRTWISAVGVITAQTAREFDRFARDNKIRGDTIALDSEGGSVVAALALGRAIRRFDMTTTVGKTTVLGSDAGDARARLSPNASCESMCAFVLLGGARRYVAPEARVLVHMIWLANKSERAQGASYTADELGLVQRDIGTIASYTVEMVGSIELLEAALRIPPWEPLYALAAEELRRMRLTIPELGAEIPFVGTDAMAHVDQGAPAAERAVRLSGGGL